MRKLKLGGSGILLGLVPKPKILPAELGCPAYYGPGTGHPLPPGNLQPNELTPSMQQEPWALGLTLGPEFGGVFPALPKTQPTSHKHLSPGFQPGPPRPAHLEMPQEGDKSPAEAGSL